MNPYSLTYQEVIKFINDKPLDFYLREISTDQEWRVEACCDTIVNNISITIVFKDDVLSPYRNYNQHEVATLIADLESFYNKIK